MVAGTRVGVALMVACGLTFAVSGPIAKSLMDAGWSPGATVWVRLTSAAIVLIAIAAVTDPHGLRTAHRHLRTLATYGVIALGSVQAAFFLSIEHLPVAVTLMIQFLAPILVIGWNWLMRGRTPSVPTLIGVVVALVGAALVVDVFGAGHVSAIGLFWAAVSMIGNACFFLVSERAGDVVSPTVLLAGGMTIAAATVGALVAAGALTVTVAVDDTVLADRHMPWAVSLTLLVLLCTVVPYLFGVAGGSRLGSTLMSIVLLCEVAFAAVFAWLLVGQTIGVGQVVGGASIVVGVGLALVGGPQPQHPRSGIPGRTSRVSALRAARSASAG